ncbi:MAG: choice-of-anchor B family protein [Ignavibacteria bacterium]|nr:choice-of-anchor B family protein [Ignavibacteria bacterium]
MNFVIKILLMFLLFQGLIYSQQSRNIRVLAHINHNTFHSSCWGYSAGGREYAIYGWYNGTSFVDITDENNIREVVFLPGRYSGWREMKVYKNYLYIVSEADSSGIQIVDLSRLPNTVDLINTYSFDGFRRAHTISQNGRYLYINGGNYREGGIVVLDAGANPESPVKMGEWQVDYVHDSRIVNDTIWACNPLTGKVSVIDASDKNGLKKITSWINGSFPVPHNCAVTDDGKYLYVCDENFNNPGKLKIWNISDKKDIVFVNEWKVNGTSESVHNVEIFGNYAFLSYYGEGARVLDITDPVNPFEIAYLKTSACWQVYYFPSGKIIASDIYDGLYVLKTQNPISVNNIKTPAEVFSLSQNYPNPFNPKTTIKYKVPVSDYKSYDITKLTVYNALGKEVRVLVDQYLEPGEYEFEWNAAGFPSGIYFYELLTGSYRETKKMLLIK